MPEKSLTIAAYAAGASLAAATLVYVFGPTFFLDEDPSTSRNDRKRMAVGLSNPANDCFINAILQALAGLPTFRSYLFRELQQRQQDGKDVYMDLGQTLVENGKTENKPAWLRLSLQTGTLTAALKDMLDALNGQPNSRKTISASAFVSAVEQAFKTRVSRHQQDAQEFLQLIVERLADEHKAGAAARRRAIENGALPAQNAVQAEEKNTDVKMQRLSASSSDFTSHSEKPINAEEELPAADQSPEAGSPTTRAVREQANLPFEGQLESRIECGTCHFKPKPSVTNFVTLTLNVPHASSSTTLDACLDGMMKVERIDGFRCDRCRLEHARGLILRQLKKTGLSDAQHSALERDLTLLVEVIEKDPENPPAGVRLPDPSTAPQCSITRYMRISSFPQLLAIHLSRSVWDGHSSSSKNTARVSFPELLHLGGLMDRKIYRLLGMVTHKGGHNSGHYESFRRQSPAHLDEEGTRPDHGSGTDELKHSRPGSEDAKMDVASAASPIKTEAASTASPAKTNNWLSDAHPLTLKAVSQAKLVDRKRKSQDRWWRISDDKVKEGKLVDVLGMQKEVYLLFYELKTS